MGVEQFLPAPQSTPFLGTAQAREHLHQYSCPMLTKIEKRIHGYDRELKFDMGGIAADVVDEQSEGREGR